MDGPRKYRLVHCRGVDGHKRRQNGKDGVDMIDTMPPKEPWRLIACPKCVRVGILWRIGTSLKDAGELRRWPWLIRLGYNLRWGIR
jgi:hypothetical protein